MPSESRFALKQDHHATKDGGWPPTRAGTLPHLVAGSLIHVSQRFRGGTLSYREAEHEVPFEWELCGSAVLIIWGTKKRSWDVNHPWAAGRQSEIYDFVANEMTLGKPLASKFKIDLESGTITIP